MQTKKGTWFLALGVAPILLSLVMHDWQLLALGLPFLFLYWASALTYVGNRPDLVLEKFLSTRKVTEGDEIEVTVTVRSRHAHGWIELFERMPGRLEIASGAPYHAASVRRRGAVRHHFVVRAPLRGAYRVGPTVARVRSFLGLFYREVEADESPLLEVMPKSVPIRALGVTGGKPKRRMGSVQVRQRGEGTDFHGLRQYTITDDPRRINWRASARSPHLVVNQFEMEDVADVTLLLDTREANLVGTTGDNPLDHGARATASLAEMLIHGRNRLAYLTYGDPDLEHWVYAESSRKQLYKILDKLVEARARGDQGLGSIVDRAITYLLPSRSMVIIVSGLAQDDTIEDGVRRLLAHGHPVLILSPSPVAIEVALSDTVAERASLALLAVERAALLDRLRRVGAGVVDWNPTQHLSMVLEGVNVSVGR